VPSRPIVFVAREPDETLRTFLPVLAELQRRGRDCLVLFHHGPSAWALERLRQLNVPWIRVRLPGRETKAGMLARPGLGSAAAELAQLWCVRRLAGRLIARTDPGGVVVIQDTLLLERFLVREANRRGRGTLVVQWAFTFPQSTYDRLRQIQALGGRRPAGSSLGVDPSSPRARGEGLHGEGPPKGGRRLSARLYGLAQQLLGVKFDLVNSYGGGEARVFAVMGEAFREQFLAQGVRKARIEVTGHPLHDAAFAQRSAEAAERSAELKARYGLPAGSRVILYATQPVLWRGVMSREELAENVRGLGRAVDALGPEFLLVVKLHPREALEDYADAIGPGQPIRLIKDAEITELIDPAEAFISSSSSTVLLAMMLDKPIVTINFNQVPHFDYYASIGGTLHARTLPQAAEALHLAVFDEPIRARLAAERAVVLARHARFDGGAVERLADLILAEARG
jgi:hypothetical protein